MCGRYALSLRPSQVRQLLANQDMPADEAPPDDDERIRQSYNFCPGYHGLIYRAQTSDRGGSTEEQDGDGEPSPKKAKLSHNAPTHEVDGLATHETKYKLQAAKWGLVPFWTKRQPDYGSQMRTINCRDDSLAQNGGMWNTMKQKKRCIVVAEAFYEWLKKNGGKDKIPHCVKRKAGIVEGGKDGEAQLMCFAGLWDCVQYEGSEEKLYTYTIITTDSNKQLNFLHDRMPVILEPGSEEMRMWLDPARDTWSKELQSLLKPFNGELDCYPVDKAVGKVGNNSPSFLIPVDSKENKKNIANFFGKQAGKNEKIRTETTDRTMKAIQDASDGPRHDDEEDRKTSKVEDPETTAPLPKPEGNPDVELERAIKAETDDLDDAAMTKAAEEQVERGIKREISELDDAALLKAAESPAKKACLSPQKSTPSKTRSATKNEPRDRKTPKKGQEGNAKITSFFGK